MVLWATVEQVDVPPGDDASADGVRPCDTRVDVQIARRSWPALAWHRHDSLNGTFIHHIDDHARRVGAMSADGFAVAAEAEGLPGDVARLLAAASDPFEPPLERLRSASLAAVYLDALRRGLVAELDRAGLPWVLLADALGVSVAEARVLWGPEHTRGDLTGSAPARPFRTGLGHRLLPTPCEVTPETHELEA